MTSWAVVALGSNLGRGGQSPADLIDAGAMALQRIPGVVGMSTSSTWSTEPVRAQGGTFANAVAHLRFAEQAMPAPEDLLAELMAIEAAHGRVRPEVGTAVGPSVSPSVSPSVNPSVVPSSGSDSAPSASLSEARTLDLDLICTSQGPHRSPRLTLPHPRAHERLFVVGPLAELLPDLPMLLPSGKSARAADLRDGLTNAAASNRSCHVG